VTSSEQLLLVVSRDCHLCDLARRMLGRRGLSYREIDLADPEAGELAAAGVPVVFFPVLVSGRRVLAYGAITDAELDAALAEERAA
jgi:glutaredoxin